MAGLVRQVLKALLPGRPGHVAHSLAFSTGDVQRSQKTGRVTVFLSFHNKGCAKLWMKGISDGRVAAIRERWLADCDTLHKRALARQDSNPKAGRGIRKGIPCAR